MFRILTMLAFLAVTPAFAAKWIRMTSPHFEAYTDAGDRTARRALTRFEQIRQVFADTAPSLSASRMPVRVFVFSSERDYRTFRPAPAVVGFYQSGPDRDYIVMLDAGPEATRVGFHEYTHLVLNHGAATMPSWLEEGTAEFYSTLQMDAGRLAVGGTIPTHLDTLRDKSWLSAAQLSLVRKDSPDYNERGKAGVFYAQSWALVHMLNLSPQFHGRLPRFVDGISKGEASTLAFREAFGMSLDDALARLRSYVAKPLRQIEVSAPDFDSMPVSEATPVAPEEELLAKAELLLVMGKDEAASELLDQAMAKYPDSPAAETGAAMLASRAKRFDEARRHLERAIELGARDGSTYFEYAMLLRDGNAPRAKVDEFLLKTVEASPEYAEAHFLLGVRASEEGRYEDAVKRLRQATTILPRQAYFWHALAYAYFKMGRMEESKAAAYRALSAAASPNEEEMARAALRLSESRTAPPAPKAGVITPPSWLNPKGDRRAEGELVSVDCAVGTARLHVRTAEGEKVLVVSRPGSVVLKGARSANLQLSCGAQKGVHVAVEYVGATGEVTAIEFR